MEFISGHQMQALLDKQGWDRGREIIKKRKFLIGDVVQLRTDFDADIHAAQFMII